ncbi:MAG: family 10 glycosylhydrolase [Candidatus Sumerlaeia bacterium]|nr:family 10 glycosylhydrolase [Candidatus Sumerlaeia bacterium]
MRTTPRPFLILIALLLWSLPGGAAAQVAPLPSANTEPRGLEVLASSEGFTSSDEIEKLSVDVVAAGFNQLYPEARTLIGVAWPSNIEPMLPFVGRGIENPLGLLRNRVSSTVEILPWLQVMPAHNVLMGVTPPEKSPLGIAPGMASIDVTGERRAFGNLVYLDPGNPATREYLLAVILEMSQSIRADGVVLDTFEYAGREWGYSEAAIEAFRAEVGGSGPPLPNDPVWSAWRREQLTNALRLMRSRIRSVLPQFKFSVVIDASGPPPATWDEYTAGTAYSEKMQDWLGWCRDGLLEQIVIRFHERHGTETLANLEAWSRFLADNAGLAVPVVSLSGRANFTENLVAQHRTVRTRGVGTSLNHYAFPTRDMNLGFYEGLRRSAFGTNFGVRLSPEPRRGERESRQFTRMQPPPPEYPRAARREATPTPEPPLRFVTPTPPPSPTPVPVLRPSPIVRVIVLRNGRQIQGVVAEVRDSTYVILPEGGTQMVVSKAQVQGIYPSIEETP